MADPRRQAFEIVVLRSRQGITMGILERAPVMRARSAADKEVRPADLFSGEREPRLAD